MSVNMALDIPILKVSRLWMNSMVFTDVTAVALYRIVDKVSEITHSIYDKIMKITPIIVAQDKVFYGS